MSDVMDQMQDFEDFSYENDIDPFCNDGDLPRDIAHEDQLVKEAAMSKPNENENELGEAPVSWNTKYIDPRGFQCQLTLRGNTGYQLFDKVDAALDRLLESECRPYPDNRPTKQAKPLSVHNPTFCYLHDVQMDRYEKDGRSWYSHKHGDSWCKGIDPNV